MKPTMKLKNKKISIQYKVEKSPNYNPRGKFDISYLIIHYTGTDTLRKALKIFLDKRSKLSCHWLISKGGTLYKIVQEENIAWHAGKSYWKGEFNLNNRSIGIELENPGHGKNYNSFPKKQMTSLEHLVKDLIVKYKINIKNVLGHSDIAPERKLDPGEYFNWSYLAEKGLAFCPKHKVIKNNKIIFQLGHQSTEIAALKKKLKCIGYKCNNSNKFDLQLKLVIEAFQRRFLPESINGIIDRNLVKRVNALVKKT